MTESNEWIGTLRQKSSFYCSILILSGGLWMIGAHPYITRVDVALFLFLTGLSVVAFRVNHSFIGIGASCFAGIGPFLAAYSRNPGPNLIDGVALVLVLTVAYYSVSTGKKASYL